MHYFLSYTIFNKGVVRKMDGLTSPVFQCGRISAKGFHYW